LLYEEALGAKGEGQRATVDVLVIQMRSTRDPHESGKKFFNNQYLIQVIQLIHTKKEIVMLTH